MDQHQQVAALFDRVAATYDQVGVEFFQPIADGLLAQLDPRLGERALDVGCGRGAVLLPLTRAVGAAGSVTGIDLSPQMLDASAAALAAAGLDAELLLADAAAPGLPPESYDLVASSLVLFFLSDPAAALAAWVGLLKPDGRLGISTFGSVSETWRPVDKVFDPYLPPQMLDARTSGAAGPFASDAGVEALMLAAGLHSVRTHSTTVSVRFRDAEQWYAWSRSTGQRRMWELVPDESHESVRARAVELLEATRDDAGIGFDQTVRYTLGTR